MSPQVDRVFQDEFIGVVPRHFRVLKVIADLPRIILLAIQKKM